MTIPTDEQISELYDEVYTRYADNDIGNNFIEILTIREALNRWGTPEPISLEYREPQPSDLDDCGSCWWWDEVNQCYVSLCGDMGGIHRIREVNKLNDYPHYYTHWLPHWAIKEPKEKDESCN
jgi:hypothetical protein